mgnify:CR=1 FL=1
MHFAFGQAFTGSITDHHVINAPGHALQVDRDQGIRSTNREGPVIDQRPDPVVDPDGTLTHCSPTVVIRNSKSSVVGRRENEQLATGQSHNAHRR